MNGTSENYASSATSSTDSPEKPLGQESYPQEKSPHSQFHGEDLEYLERLERATDGGYTEEDLEIIAAHLHDRTIDECLEIIKKALVEHHNDPNIRLEHYHYLQSLAEGLTENMTEKEYEIMVKFEAFLIQDWSIYPEVRSCTRPIDEADDNSYENLRVYLISIIWSCAGSVLATFFGVRFPSISLSNVALQMLIAYTGKLVAYIPGFSFPVGFGRRFRTGNGPWTFKEQQLATIGMGVGNTVPYAQYPVISMANKYFYGFSGAGSFGFIIMLTLSSNVMGFGLAGVFRSFLVYPARCVWFSVLPQIKLSRVLIKEDKRQNTNGWILKGWEFYLLFTVLQFCWYWITDFVFQFLSYFDWLAFAAPDNVNLNAICGVQSGLGVNPIPTLDPSVFLATPLVTPFFSTVLMLCGMFFSMFAIIIMWYTNVRWTSYLPINTNNLYDRFGQPFDVSKVLDAKNNLDPEKYQNYSLPFWTAGNIVNYGSFFALYPAMIVSTLLEYHGLLWNSLKAFWTIILHPKKTTTMYNDRFMRAQRKYKEVPEWWYMVALVICIALGIATVEYYKITNTPVWTIFFAVGLSAVFMVPSGILFATTNNQIVINVLYELIIGLAIPGNGTALMIAKTYATNFMIETDTYIGNLKTAHYTGIAPRSLFRIQIISMICNSFVQAGLMMWQANDGIKDLCDPANATTNKFTCQSNRTYFNAAVQWGTIGPARVLKGLYPGMSWCFLLGALYPFPFWAVRKFVIPYMRKALGPDAPSWKRKLFGFEWVISVNEVVLLSGGVQWAPSNFMYYFPWLAIGWFFQVFLKHRYPLWWAKYNYLLYAAISTGYSFSGLIVFFAVEYNHIVTIDWWGNDTGMNRPIDASAPPVRLPMPERGWFGPEPGHFP